MVEKSKETQLNGNEVAILTLVWMVILPVAIVLRGLVLHSCWVWFVMPFGVSDITIIHCYGLSVLVSCVAGSTFSDPRKDFKGMVVLIISMPLRNLWVWGTAYVVHCWM